MLTTNLNMTKRRKSTCWILKKIHLFKFWKSRKNSIVLEKFNLLMKTKSLSCCSLWKMMLLICRYTRYFREWMKNRRRVKMKCFMSSHWNRTYYCFWIFKWGLYLQMIRYWFRSSKLTAASIPYMTLNLNKFNILRTSNNAQMTSIWRTQISHFHLIIKKPSLKLKLRIKMNSK